MITAILLAAGESTRMGQQKVLLPFGETTILERIVRTCEAAGLQDILVVTGHNPEPVQALAVTLPCRTVHNAHYKKGMLSSIRRGIQALPKDTTGFLLFLGDQPEISPDIVRAVHEALTAKPKNIIIPTHKGRRGHPTGIPAQFHDAIHTRYDNIGLRGLMQEYADAVNNLEFKDSGILFDLDTPEEYRAALKRKN